MANTEPRRRTPKGFVRTPATCATPAAHVGFCTGHILSGEEKGRCCRAKARVGTNVCDAHGANLGTVVQKGQVRVLEQRAQGVLAKITRSADFAAVENPLEDLLKVAAEVLAFKDAVASLVGELSAIRYEDQRGAEQLRAEVVVYERALDRAASTLADIVRLGIEDRLAKIDEVRTTALVYAIDRILSDLGHNPRAPEVAGVVVKHMKALSA